MEGKLKETIESLAVSALCLSTGHLEPFQHWCKLTTNFRWTDLLIFLFSAFLAGFVGTIGLFLTVRFAYSSLVKIFQARKQNKKTVTINASLPCEKTISVVNSFTTANDIQTRQRAMTLGAYIGEVRNVECTPFSSLERLSFAFRMPKTRTAPLFRVCLRHRSAVFPVSTQVEHLRFSQSLSTIRCRILAKTMKTTKTNAAAPHRRHPTVKTNRPTPTNAVHLFRPFGSTVERIKFTLLAVSICSTKAIDFFSNACGNTVEKWLSVCTTVEVFTNWNLACPSTELKHACSMSNAMPIKSIVSPARTRRISSRVSFISKRMKRPSMFVATTWQSFPRDTSWKN